jgi:glycine/D-amino acid oxidase-like deaminating enzyme
MPAPHRSTNPTADAVVIGAGVVGASIALELQRSGRRVVVVDKGEAVGGGSTSASASIVRFTYSTIEGVAVSFEAMHRWLDWAGHLGLPRRSTGSGEGPLATFHQIGMLNLEPPGTDRSAMFAHFDRIGVAYEILDGPALEARFPAIDGRLFGPPRLPTDPAFFAEPTGRVEAFHCPQAGFIDDPQLAAVNLMDAARAAGTEVRLRSPVRTVLRSADRVTGVELAGGDLLSAPVVVNAAGPWSPAVNRLAGVTGDMRIGTRALRQDVASTGAPPGFGVGDGGAVVADLDLGTYNRPQPGGSYLAGGVEAECDPLVWVDDPDTDRPTPDPAMWEAIILRLARRIPTMAVPHRPTGLASHYDVSDDWIPIYDRSSLDGFYLAVGTSGNQFKNAPLIGEMMTAIIDAVEGGRDHDADPVTYHCPTAGVEVDLAHYSRRRDPAKTSGTVMG